MMLSGPIRDEIKNIQQDNTSGAVALAIKSAEVLIALAGDLQNSLVDTLPEAALALVQAQPTMAPIFNLANQVLFETNAIDKEAKRREKVLSICRDFIQSLRDANYVISQHMLTLLPSNAVIMTHSASTTVLDMLIAAKSAGKYFEVICTESRPMQEGIVLARKLGQAGITVRLVVDAAAFLFMPEVDCIIVGADSVSLGGITNKIGTVGLALAARSFNKSMYCLCSTHKFLPGNPNLRPQALRPASEIAPGSSPNVTLVNYYFDQTPLDAFTSIVTEKEILTADQVNEWLYNRPVHPLLAQQSVSG